MDRAKQTPYSEFVALTDGDLGGMQLKITYVGEQRKLLPSLVVVGPGVLDAEPAVLGVTAPNLDFGNDHIARSILNASIEELRAVLTTLDRFPNVSVAGDGSELGGMTRDALLMLSLLQRDETTARCLTVPLDPVDAELVLDALGVVLQKNKDCRDHLFILWRALGFHIGSLDPDSDDDGASDGREASRGTDPANPSSSGDGVLDGERIVLGLDPLNALQPAPEPALVAVASGPFEGSRVVEATTSPEKTSGVVTLELAYTPDQHVADAERLVFMQTFRRTGRKVNGIRVPFAPSLYLVYAGSPELDQITIDGATVDHKVGELDPYYNGDDPHDVFSVVPDKQRSGMKVRGEVRTARMLYRARTFEHHWRLLNPEGIAKVQFDYETAIFCDAGPAIGQFLGVAEWKWGKERGGAITADLVRLTPVDSRPDATVRVVGADGEAYVDVYSHGANGQPSEDYLRVVALWNKHHKFALPGPSVDVDPGVSIRVPQPVMTSLTLDVAAIEPPGSPPQLEAQRLEPSRFARRVTGAVEDGGALWDGCFPFGLPLTVTFFYGAEDVRGFDEAQLGIGWVDPRSGEVTSEGINILSKSTIERSIMFTTDRLGSFVIVGRRPS